jgi:hypothetical protein
VLCFGLDRYEQVLRLKRKGRTGFKPSGLRDELPGIPVRPLNTQRTKSPLCSERRAIGRRFNQVDNFGNGMTAWPVTFCVFPNTSCFAAAISGYISSQAIVLKCLRKREQIASGDASVNHR